MHHTHHGAGNLSGSFGMQRSIAAGGFNSSARESRKIPCDRSFVVVGVPPGDPLFWFGYRSLDP